MSFLFLSFLMVMCLRKFGLAFIYHFKPTSFFVLQVNRLNYLSKVKSTAGANNSLSLDFLCFVEFFSSVNNYMFKLQYNLHDI